MPAEFTSGFFGGGVSPWHGQGTVIEEDCVTTSEAIAYAGLDWSVDLAPVYVLHSGKARIADEHRATVRSDTGQVLGIVGTRYRSIQNREAFSFMDDLLSNGQERPIWHTAGALEGGRKIWLLARLPEDVLIGGSEGERVEPYIFFATSHDGSLAVTVACTPVRIVCSNTLMMAVGGARRTYEVRHTEGFEARVSEARKVLEIGYRYYAELERVGGQMIVQPFGDRLFESLVDELIPLPDVRKSARAHGNADRERETLWSIWRGADDLQNVRGTAWGAYNAVVAFDDHRRGSRTTGRSNAAENRMKRIMTDASLKEKAQKVIAGLVG